jgi:hypothetical protein
MITWLCRAGSIVLSNLFLVTAAAATEGINVIETGGLGTLTKCESWVLFRTCRLYHHVALPNRLAIGETVPLEFGSNPKHSSSLSLSSSKTATAVP